MWQVAGPRVPATGGCPPSSPRRKPTPTSAPPWPFAALAWGPLPPPTSGPSRAGLWLQLPVSAAIQLGLNGCLHPEAELRGLTVWPVWVCREARSQGIFFLVRVTEA